MHRAIYQRQLIFLYCDVEVHSLDYATAYCDVSIVQECFQLHMDRYWTYCVTLHTHLL